MKKNKAKVLHWIPMGMFPATVMFGCGFSYEEIESILIEKKANDWLTALHGNENFKTATNIGGEVTLET